MSVHEIKVISNPKTKEITEKHIITICFFIVEVVGGNRNVKNI